jgi:hypothetical protein
MIEETEEAKKCTLSGNEPKTLEGPAPDEIDPTTGMHKDYWVLCPEERAKGFVRPVRRSYMHVGEQPKGPTRELTADEQERYKDCGYVVHEDYPASEYPTLGRFWTQEQLNHKGCGVVTTMGNALAETYARDPHFYGATFCCGCGKHFPVREFVWDGTTEIVGS